MLGKNLQVIRHYIRKVLQLRLFCDRVWGPVRPWSLQRGWDRCRTPGSMMVTGSISRRETGPTNLAHCFISGSCKVSRLRAESLEKIRYGFPKVHRLCRDIVWNNSFSFEVQTKDLLLMVGLSTALRVTSLTTPACRILLPNTSRPLHPGEKDI